MDYRTALERLVSLAHTDRIVSGHSSQASPYTLARMCELLRLLGDPQLQVPAVHVTGTKGKGSVSAMMHSILLAAGHRAGLYTSPHLHTYRERIKLGREPLDEAAFAHLVETLWPKVEELASRDSADQVTHFEMLTAMAFACFNEAGCAYEVLEVGVGGRLDATNVIERPLVSILTSIGLDHTAVLGNTLAEIAWEKAGIVKPGRPVVSAPQRPEAMDVIRRVAGDRGARLTEVEQCYRFERIRSDLSGQHFRIHEPRGLFEGWIPLLGQHQLENAACVLSACRVLQEQGVHLPDDAILQGLRSVEWPARLEVLRRDPLFIIDGAHNPHSAACLRMAVEGYLPHRRLFLIFGISLDKDLAGIVNELAPITHRVLACRSRHYRSRSPADIAALFEARGVRAQECATVDEAIRAAIELAEPGDLILGAGSLFTVAEIREKVLGIPLELYPQLRTMEEYGKHH
jgi:dihydrofolate synthase/folylpolyglutamate synthase